jgi:hypothetical protein
MVFQSEDRSAERNWAVKSRGSSMAAQPQGLSLNWALAFDPDASSKWQVDPQGGA